MAIFDIFPLGGDRAERQRREQELEDRRNQGILTGSAVGELLGGQAGPFLPSLLDMGTGRTKALAQQDPNVQAGILGRALQQPGTAALAQQQVGQALPQAPLTEVQQAQIESSTAATNLAMARIADLGVARSRELDRITREEQASRVTNRKEFQAALQSNKIIGAGINGATRLAQLQSTLNAPQASKLDLANAAVFLSQMIEPGLAVRGDDRIAVDRGSSPGLIAFANEVNQFLGEEIDIATGRENILRTARNILKPLITGTNEALDFWRQAGIDTPGVVGGDVGRILGVDPAVLELLKDLQIEEF